MVRHSYLKDEGTALEKDIIDCSLGINPCGVTPKLTKDMYAATFDVLASYPAHPYVETRRHICEYFSDVASLDVSDCLDGFHGSCWFSLLLSAVALVGSLAVGRVRAA